MWQRWSGPVGDPAAHALAAPAHRGDGDLS